MEAKKKDNTISMGDVMKVFVSSQSPIKLAAVKQAFARMGYKVETIGFNVESGVAAQPLSFEETHTGAQNRHAKLRGLVGDKNGYLITHESGLVKLITDASWIGCEVAIIEKYPDGQKRVGFDLGLECPQAMMDKIPHEYPELGALIKAEYGFTEKDAPTFLTNGKISRADLIAQTMYKMLAQMDTNI